MRTRDLRASGSCVSCWGRPSAVALGDYIALVQAASARGAGWLALFPDTVELEMTTDITVDGLALARLDATHHLPVPVAVRRDDMLAALQRCDASVSGRRVALPRRLWHAFLVSDAGMNYAQARQINGAGAISKLHEGAVMRDNCWIHSDEVAAARLLPDGVARCLSCRTPFDARTPNLMLTTPLERIRLLVRAQHIGEAVRQLRALDPAVFDERPQGLWDLLQQAVAGRRIELVGFICLLFPLARLWPGFTAALYRSIEDPLVSPSLARQMLSCGVPSTEPSTDLEKLVQRIIERHAAVPARLLGKLQLVFENHRALGLDFQSHVQDSIDTWARWSRGFSDEHFLAGFALFIKYAQLVRLPELSGPRREFMCDDMILDAAGWNDARLLAYLCEKHKLDIHVVSKYNENAYSCTSSPGVVLYLRAQNVDPHLTNNYGETALTTLLRRVLLAKHKPPPDDVYACVQCYFSFGLHIVPPDCKIGPRAPSPAEDFYARPLELAEDAARQFPEYRAVLDLVAYVHAHNRLPQPPAHAPAPQPRPRSSLALAAQHLVGAPRAVRRLPAPPALPALREPHIPLRK